jgi:hypothetical protein
MTPARFLPLALAFALGCAHDPPPAAAAAPPPATPTGLEQWSANHPEASRELGEWVRTHPDAAARLFEWDGHHPEKSKLFVTWALTHPAMTIDAFAAEHPGWPVFDQIIERHRPAAETFLLWCRRHPPAAEALMNHSGGLDWAGRHLYADYWHMENPGY